MDYCKKKQWEMHEQLKGKLEVVSKVKIETRDDLSTAYTPGVAAPCLEIQKNPNKSYELTGRGNCVAVITDGSAVLGLGDIGPEAGMPVMEGKMCLIQRIWRSGCNSFMYSKQRCWRNCENDFFACGKFWRN